jgi:hypothetical protein
MSGFKIWACLGFLLLAGWVSMWAQEAASSAAVPMLVNFSGTLADATGQPLTSATSVTFALYQNQQGGAPLWAETQTVQPNSSGWYTVALGAVTQGLPVGLFVTGEPRWLEVQAQGQAIQPRIILLSVPYALKAGDAQTIGGLPPSAFVLAIRNSSSLTTAGAQTESSAPSSLPPSSSGVTTTGGTVNTLPLWTTATNIQSSALTQTGTGNTAKIGIGTSTPATTLDIKGSNTVRGTLSLPSVSVATSTKGSNSQPFNLAASAYNSSTASAVTQTFQWQAEPVGNDTSTAGGSLNLLFGQGTSKPTETGLLIGSNGQITFAAGQTFPGTGTGDGTVTSVATGSGLAGGPITSSGTLSIASGGVSNAMLANPSLTVAAGTALTGGGAVSLGGSTTLNLDTTKVPLLAASNTFTGNQTTNGNLTATGAVAAAVYDIGSTQILSILPGQFNLYVGQSSGQGAGANNTGSNNTSVGYQTLFNNTSGGANVAVGTDTMYNNTTGAEDTAVGENALASNTSGAQNTAVGTQALMSNTTGGGNAAAGLNALFHNSTGSSNTATGDGALYGNTTGSSNTASGFLAGGSLDGTSTTGSSNTFLGTSTNASTGTLNNATAIGANAEVSESNALVLGSINGVNGATSNVNVGIGTTAPAFTLDVHGTGNFTGNVTFASTQTFPGTGTITGVTAGSGLSGGGSSGGVTLALAANACASGNALSALPFTCSPFATLGNNTFTGTETVNGNLSATGMVSSAGFQIGSTLFAFGSSSSGSAFLGFAGNTTTTGAFNTATGYGALSSNTSGAVNAATGNGALESNTTGSGNTAIGFSALGANTTGGSNTAIGSQALEANMTGSNNTANGYNALQLTQGINNTALGYNTGNPVDGSYLTGASNLFLGFGAAPSTGGLSNAGAIGVLATVSQSNSIVIGGIANVNGATVTQSVGVATTAPTNIFTVGRDKGFAIADGWTTYSSRRWKMNIRTLPDALVKVEQLRGVSYDMKDSGKHEIVVIAEEVGKVVPELVTYEANGTDARGVDYSRLTALLIEAVKGQQAQISAQQSQIRAQQVQIRNLQSKVRTQSTRLDSRLAKLEGRVAQTKLARAASVGDTSSALAKVPSKPGNN